MEQYKPDKLAELIVYISSSSTRDTTFGKTKLIKLLAYADFEAYKRLGHSITGDRYQKLEHGPAPRDAPGTLEQLEAAGVIVENPVPMGNYVQRRYRARRAADTTLFTDAELALVDEILARFARVGGAAISAESHRDFVGWEIAELYEDIPYETALLTDEDPSAETLSQGRKILAGLARRGS